METLGYREGRDISYEWRFAEGDYEGIPRHVAEIVRTRPDAILTQLSVMTRAFAKATTTIPIVGLIDDPVREGYTKPGSVLPTGNVTGLADLYTQCATKLFELLKACMPGPIRLAVLAPELSTTPVITEFLIVKEAAAREAGIDTVAFRFRDRDGFVSAIKSMPARGVRAITQVGLPTGMGIAEVVQLALGQGLPVVAASPFYNARFGYLLAFRGLYGDAADVDSSFRRQATQLDKVLRGTPATWIPFQMPERFVLGINRKTATALKIVIPEGVYLRAEKIYDGWDQ